MTRLKFFAVTLPFFFTSAAFADDGATSSVGTGSQFMHQADEGKWELTPGVTVGQSKMNFNTDNSTDGQTQDTDNYSNISLMGEYAISQMVSVGLKIGYQTENISESPSNSAPNVSAKGLTDPSVFVKARMNLGPGSFRYGSNLSVATGNAVVNAAGNSNELTGGITLTPFVGYELEAGPGIVGARVAYDIYQSDRNVTIKNSVSGKLKAGNVLNATAFYELNFSPLVWGFDIGWIKNSATKYSDNTGSVDDNDSYSTLVGATYVAWQVAPSIVLLPTFGYGTPNGLVNDTAGQTSAGGIYGTIAARFAF